MTTTKTPKTYKFHVDSGHGWLAVKRQELIDLGIIDKVSHYSYQRGKSVYLEEDCDMSLFILTLKKNNTSYVIVENGKWVHRSPIRSYDSFKKN